MCDNWCNHLNTPVFHQYQTKSHQTKQGALVISETQHLSKHLIKHSYLIFPENKKLCDIIMARTFAVEWKQDMFSHALHNDALISDSHEIYWSWKTYCLLISKVIIPSQSNAWLTCKCSDSGVNTSTTWPLDKSLAQTRHGGSQR
jgi:hypothetical protein